MDYNSPEEIQDKPAAQKLPFNNLYLNAGVVDGQNKFWMYLFCIAFFIFGYASAGFVLVKVMEKRAYSLGISAREILANPSMILDPAKMQVDKNIILLSEFGLFAVALLFFFAGIKFFHHKHFISLITGFEKFRFRNFFFGFGIWVIAALTYILIAYLTGPLNSLVLQFDPSRFTILFLICIIFLPIQTLAEEVIFRGYIMQGLSQVFMNGILPLILTSLMFGLAHMSNPEAAAFGVGIMLTYYTMFGLFLGAITLLSEGLELAYGIHLANNLVGALTVTSQAAVLKTDAVFYAKSEDPGAELLISFCSIIVVFVVFWMRFKWKDFSLLIK
jgi:membrane protease YdiL (CAAX protease family)